MEEGLVGLLLNYAPLTALASQRVYWLRAPQNVAKPYVVLQVITAIPDVSHSGPNGLVAGRVQADCYGTTYNSAKGVARAVTNRLSGFKGVYSGTIFDGVFKDAERDEYEDDESPEKLFRVSIDFIIWHKGE